MDVFSQIQILWAHAATLSAIALIIWGIRGLIQDYRNDRLARQLLEILKNAPSKEREKAFRGLAEFVEAQHAEPHFPKLLRPRSTPP